MQQVAKGNQLHIGLFGKRNAGKSTLMNVLLRQEMSIVSPVAGTTTDLVHKSIEFHPLGPVVFVDTPGIDDEGELGTLRVEKTKKALKEVDLVLWVCNEVITPQEKEMLEEIKKSNVPVVLVHNTRTLAWKVQGDKLVVNAKEQIGIEDLRDAIVKVLQTKEEHLCIGDMVTEGQVVLLVAPQDIQAPKGRLILPQVQVMRELLDAKAIPMMTTLHTLERTLKCLCEAPHLVVTDSQVFKEVREMVPAEVPLTSFSILMARQKGDLDVYRKGAKAIYKLQPNDHILIAESCTHNPLHEDIAREKIPQALQKKCGMPLQFHWTTGTTFPNDLSKYALVIQCGGCMHTPAQIGARIQKAKSYEVPMTNFGVLLAELSGTLDAITFGDANC
ncbi:MAG: [FeFe] hydrogenase H-cluster maturation GTPase HydF [Cellulosilyticaceae bacterium]